MELYGVRRDGCLLWAGGIDALAYGRIAEHAGEVLVHRVAWGLVHGFNPRVGEVDHTCMRRRCFDVAHLEPVARLENILRGRGPRSTRMRRRGDLQHRLCADGSCWREAVERSLCVEHFGEWQADYAAAKLRVSQARRECTVHGCHAHYRTQGYCERHRGQKRLWGYIEEDYPLPLMSHVPALRAAAGMTLTEFARRVGLAAPGAACNWEKGRAAVGLRHRPAVYGLLTEMCTAVGWDYDAWVAGFGRLDSHAS